MTGTAAADRDRLKVTFESVAGRYHAARPGYPAALFDELAAAAHLRPGARLLEVGAGTGKATIPLAARGYDITALEPGARLAAAARENLHGYPNVQVVQQPFESWQPGDAGRFDLVYSATAWHWIDPAARFPLAARCLRPGGHLAIWAALHVIPDADGDPFFGEIQDVYDDIGEGLPDGAQHPVHGSLPGDAADIEASGLFELTATAEFLWSRRYTAEQYIALLDTFSGHIAMAGWQRDRLYGEIRRRLAARPDGSVLRHWGALLQVARRRDTESEKP